MQYLFITLKSDLFCTLKILGGCKMSKLSKRKTQNRRRHNRKKIKNNKCSKNLQCKKELRFVAYMPEDDACHFSSLLCGTDIQNILSPKYQNFSFGNVVYTRISLHVRHHEFDRACQIMENSFPLSAVVDYFRMPKDEVSSPDLICEKNLCMIGQITHETVDQFKGDAKESTALSDSEILFYQIPDGPNNCAVAVMVEIYTNDINREFVEAVLSDGWMSEKWGKHFQPISN